MSYNLYNVQGGIEFNKGIVYVTSHVDPYTVGSDYTNTQINLMSKGSVWINTTDGTMRTKTSTSNNSISDWSQVSTGSGTPSPVASKTYNIVIAASNSPSEIKELADYVCDGTDDHVEINSAITSLTTGGSIYLAEGTYTVNASIRIKSDISLYGCYKKSIIKVKNATTTAFPIITHVAVGTITNLLIDSISIDGNKANDSNTHHAIYLDVLQYTIIRDCIFYNLTDTSKAIYLYQTSPSISYYVTVRNCTFMNCAGRAIEIKAHASASVQSQYFFIENCFFNNNGAIYVYSSDATYKIYDVVITNNRIGGNSSVSGISLLRADRFMICDNSLYNASTIDIQYCAIGKISCNSSVNTGNYIGISVTNSNNIDITNNTIGSGNTTGIQVATCSYLNITSNIVTTRTGNSFYQTGTFLHSVLSNNVFTVCTSNCYLTNGNSVVITNNVITYIGATSSYFSAATLTNSVLVGNRISENYTITTNINNQIAYNALVND